jgi:hypothetical protein
MYEFEWSRIRGHFNLTLSCATDDRAGSRSVPEEFAFLQAPLQPLAQLQRCRLIVIIVVVNLLEPRVLQSEYRAAIH